MCKTIISIYYLDLSIKFSLEGFGGISKFFAEQSQEERVHMLKLIDLQIIQLKN